MKKSAHHHYDIDDNGNNDDHHHLTIEVFEDGVIFSMMKIETELIELFYRFFFFIHFCFVFGFMTFFDSKFWNFRIITNNIQ